MVVKHSVKRITIKIYKIFKKSNSLTQSIEQINWNVTHSWLLLWSRECSYGTVIIILSHNLSANGTISIAWPLYSLSPSKVRPHLLPITLYVNIYIQNAIRYGITTRFQYRTRNSRGCRLPLCTISISPPVIHCCCSCYGVCVCVYGTDIILFVRGVYIYCFKIHFYYPHIIKI